MNKAYIYKLNPAAEQAVMFEKTFGCCRKVWNLMLADRISAYQETGHFTETTPASYKEEHPYLKEVDSLALANVQMHLRAAFKNCFSKEHKKNTGFPKFKSRKKAKKSYTTNNQGGTVAVTDGFVKLPKVGFVKAVTHRLPPDGWVIKSATVYKSSDGLYYVSVLFEYKETVAAVPVSDNAIGLDYASDGLYIDDQGNRGSSHKYFRENEKKLAKLQKQLSKKRGSRKGETRSTNYEKQLRKVNKLQRHIANCRKDNTHKLSTEIANRYDVVCVEDLNMRQMANKKFGNGKAALDNGYGMFLSMLEYKMADRGKYFVRVSKWYPSSQVCHRCGAIHPEMKNLKMRRMVCSCGLDDSRDHNAAVNIRSEGLRILKAAA